MEVYGTQIVKVDIDPEDVIKKLIEKTIGSGWVFEKDGKYYRGFEERGLHRTYDDQEEISEKRYKYVAALQFIQDELKEKRLAKQAKNT